MRRLFAVSALVLATAGCGARAVQVESAPAAAPTVTLTVTNALTQAVNVYVVTGGSDQLVNQVAANPTTELPVRGVSVGAVVRLKATTSDGSKTYTKDGVTLQSSNSWKVP
ncbi:MAG: hypothetical protein U0132_21090 [Gemmatimonadaceae bacterium]